LFVPNHIIRPILDNCLIYKACYYLNPDHSVLYELISEVILYALIY